MLTSAIYFTVLWIFRDDDNRCESFSLPFHTRDRSRLPSSYFWNAIVMNIGKVYSSDTIISYKWLIITPRVSDSCRDRRLSTETNICLEFQLVFIRIKHDVEIVLYCYSKYGKCKSNRCNRDGWRVSFVRFSNPFCCFTCYANLQNVRGFQANCTALHDCIFLALYFYL